MGRKHQFLTPILLSIAGMFLHSCNDTGVSNISFDTSQIWYDHKVSLLVLLKDSVFVANNIPDVKVFIGKDSIFKNGKYFPIYKYQDKGVIGRWRFVTTDKTNPKIELSYCANEDNNNPHAISKKDIFIRRSYLFREGDMFGDIFLRAYFSCDSTKVVELHPNKTIQLKNDYINILY